MKTVYLKVDEEYVDGAGKVAGAKGSSGSTDILVEFSPDWEALSKYATTRDAKGLHPEVIVLTELMKEPIGEEEEERYAYRFSLTANAMSEEGHMSITFTGYEIEDGNETETIINTAIAKLRVLPSDYSEMDDGSVTPTIAQQLQSEIDEIKDDIAIATHAQEYAEAAAESAGESAGSATLSESWAVGGTGTREGEDTNNSSYFAGQSELSADESDNSAKLSESWAKGDTGERAGEDTNNSKYFSEVSEGKSTLSESWAVGGTGTREGEDTNNAKYWAEQAQGAVAGVSSFNGRSGAVVPADDDYSIGQIAATGSEGQVPMLNSQGKLAMTTLPTPTSDLEDLNDVDIQLTPTNGQVLSYDSSSSKWVNSDPEGGGHTIKNEAGTAATQRSNLQFVDSQVADDSTNGATVIENVKEISRSDFNNLGFNTDGFYLVDGDSNVYMTANNLEYRTGTSTKQALDRTEGNFGNIENGDTSSQAYTVGEYIVRNDVFYRVKASIAQGDSFTVGTNIEVKPVGEVLTTLNSKLSYRNIHTSVANGTKTFGQALSEMSTYYNNLTESEKLSAIIVASGEAYQNNYLPNGQFFRNGSDGIFFMNVTSGTYSRRLYTDITNLVDRSTVVLPFDITLKAR